MRRIAEIVVSLKDSLISQLMPVAPLQPQNRNDLANSERMSTGGAASNSGSSEDRTTQNAASILSLTNTAVCTAYYR